MEKVKKVSENGFEVSVKEQAEKGKANAAILRALAKYFDLAPSRLRIVSGHTSKNKLVEIR